LLHDASHSSQVVELSGYVWQVWPCEHQPQPSSSVQPQTLLAWEHVSTHVRRHDERHVSWRVGHSRHVSVQRSAGAQMPCEEHQPHPGTSAEHAQTSVAVAHRLAKLMLRCITGSPARRVALAELNASIDT
jgi:hypothetical protein